MTEITSRLSTALADRYRIESRLGEGGIYLAEDLAASLGPDRFLRESKSPPEVFMDR